MESAQAMKRPATLRHWILPALLLALGAGCASPDPYTGRKTRNIFSLQEDVRMGRQFHAEVVRELQNQEAPIDHDPARVALVREITSHITAHARIPDLPYQATYVGAPDIVNAYAFPGGHIMIFEGLWHPRNGLVQTVDELAAVIAHEVAHVTNRHSTQTMTRQLLPNLLLTAGMVWAAIEDKEDWQLLLGGAMLIHNGIIATRYSRKQELEADRDGMMYMAMAGYNPEAAVRVWERLAGASDNQFERALSIFSTHPRDFKRNQALHRRLPAAMAVYEAAPIQRDGSMRLADLPPMAKPPRSGK